MSIFLSNKQIRYTNLQQRIMLAQSRHVDRFIPSRSNSAYQQQSSFQTNSYYDNYLKHNLCPSSRVLSYANKQNQEYNCFTNKNHSTSFNSSPNCSSSKNRNYQKLHPCSEPDKILDVPGFRDDFYLNTLDWSIHGPLVIGLDNQAYLYTPSNITELCNSSDFTYISCVKFYDYTVSLGFSDGKIQIYDLQSKLLIRSFKSHQKRVSSMAYCSQNILYSGSKDKNILVNDVRLPETTVNRLNAHRGQICALQCQPYNEHYLASGSNDNHVAIWDIRNHHFIRKYTQHKGAVKAISWCPWKTGVVATAGGAGDKSIRLWSTNQAEDLSIIKTQTQISSLLWNEESGTLISAHGHPKNQINFWRPQSAFNKVMSLEKSKTLTGHSGRILNMAMSPSKSMICSLSADQTLRFWKILETKEDPWKRKSQQTNCRWSLKIK